MMYQTRWVEKKVDSSLLVPHNKTNNKQTRKFNYKRSSKKRLCLNMINYTTLTELT